MDLNLTTIAQFIRSPKFWLGIGIILGTLLLIGFILTPMFERPPNVWRGLKPGESERTDVTKVLGEPISRKEERGYLIETYRGDSELSAHFVFYQGETAVIFKEGIDEPKEGDFEKLTAQYGREYTRLFGPFSSVGFYYYVYLEKGIALVANPSDGVVFEIWYFVPATQTEFLAGPGYELSTVPAEEEEPAPE